MNWHRKIWLLGGWLVAALPAWAQAQPAPAGDGLRGDYYADTNFERYVLTRRDTLLNFDWHGAPPAAKVPAKAYAVRWTGWLVPPTSGRYVLRLTVDGSVRFWVIGRRFLNEWPGLPLAFHEIEVDLVAGQAYPLRIEYGQYAQGSRMVLAWERYGSTSPETPSASSRKSASASSGLEIIPTRYLFSNLPPAAKVARPVPPPPVAAAATPPKTSRPADSALAASRPAGPRRAAIVDAQLAKGQSVTFKSLRFRQGRATLQPSVRASLDTLVLVLQQRPTLRLEVQGHTDNQGDPEINCQLSQRRAEAVCHYLATHGIAPKRLLPVGYGGYLPIADNRDLALRAQNRRVVLKPLP